MRVGAQKRKNNSILAALIIGGAVILAVIGFVIYMNRNVDYRQQVIFGKEAFEVTGLHGGNYRYEDVQSVEIRDSIPEIIERTRGIAVRNIKKGTFRLEGLGLARLYLLSDEGPYLYIQINDFYVIINYEDSETTEQIYTELEKMAAEYIEGTEETESQPEETRQQIEELENNSDQVNQQNEDEDNDPDEAEEQEIEEDIDVSKETGQQGSNPHKKKIVVIDAGHQAKGNPEKEPIGPNAAVMKPKVSSGTQGIKTKVPEYKVNLIVSLKLEKILADAGYEVVMIRTTHDVDLSNSERAAIANEHNADAFVRIHCNGSENTAVAGALVIGPTKKNPYFDQPLYEKSRSLSDSILDKLCAETGAKNRGVLETDTMSGINWSKVPVSIVEMGYMSNEKEDELLNTDTYQDKLAQGIAKGIMEYLNLEK